MKGTPKGVPFFIVGRGALTPPLSIVALGSTGRAEGRPPYGIDCAA